MHRHVVRRAAPEDAAAICALHRASVRELCAGAYSPEQIDAWIGGRIADDFRNAMTAGGETMFVAECAGQLSGFASISGSVLLGLYVAPARGQGAGRMLLRAVEDHARSCGVAVLVLQATLNAVGFYEKWGFSRDRPGSVIRNGQTLPIVEMHKDFTNGDLGEG